jgi:SAM-dependent methyltransferase
MPVNRAHLQALRARAQYDIASVQTAALIGVGNRLGLYRLLAGRSFTAAELAAEASLDMLYVESWLVNQAASGYVTFDPVTSSYSLDDAQAELFADARSDAFLPPSFAFSIAVAAGHEAPDLAAALDDMSRTKAQRAGSWISPATAKVLTSGANVLEVGSGAGHALIRLAALYPASRWIGCDLDGAMVTRARANAQAAGSSVRFEQADFRRFGETFADVMFCIETLHELPEAVESVRAMRAALRPGGRLIIVEPVAGDSATENINPSGRLLAATNVLYCLPHALTAGGGAIGSLAGEAKIRDVLGAAGFDGIARHESPMELVIEAAAR